MSSATGVLKKLMTTSNNNSKHLALAEKACAFLSASTDPFHAVANSIQRLESEGFSKLSASQPLSANIQPGGKYYYTVEHSTLVAFTIGSKYTPGHGGFHMIGGHTDSPNLKLKPRSKKSGSGCKLLAVECYGGGLWHTWFDRDLGVSGRVLVKQQDRIQQRLVKISDPIARISTLCIHLQSAEERKAFAVNKENHTAPIVATESINSSSNENDKQTLEEAATSQVNNNTWKDGHEPLLLQAIANQLNVSVDDIVDFELNLFDTQSAALGGIEKDFLYSARLDNLATVFCAVEAICGYDPTDCQDVKLVVAFDHEEVGSTSANGAGSPVMQEAIQRISSVLNTNAVGAFSPDLHASAVRNSFILSIDQAHAIHPNYASKHEANHAPKLNAGIVIKTNSNQRYATNGITGFVVRELGRIANIPVQEFVVRNDCGCGSTIGPTISANTGIRTVDAGMPQLSMHSCREVMGVADLTHGLKLFQTFFRHFRSVDEKLSKDIQP